MKKSTAAGVGVGVTIGAVGVLAAALLPLAGLVAGAYFAATAAAGAGMSTAAVWALGAAGAVGGLVVGKIATVVGVVLALATGVSLGGLTAKIGSLFGRGKKAPSNVSAPESVSKPLEVAPAKEQFDTAAAPKADAPAAPVQIPVITPPAA